jgi:hypothetical protein
MPPPVHTRASSTVKKGLLENQRASIFKTLSQLSKDRSSDLHKRREPAQIRLSVPEGDLHSNGGPVKSASSRPVKLQETHRDSSGSGGFVMHAEIQIPTTTSDQPGVSSLILHEDWTGPLIRSRIQSDSKLQDEFLEENEDNDVRKLIAELESSAHPARSASVDVGEDYTDLRLKLSILSSSGRDASPSFISRRMETPLRFEFEPRTEPRRSEASLPKECVPYAVALQLENAGCDWEVIAQYTAYLFSDGLDGYKAQQEKEYVIRQASEKHYEVVAQFIEEEKAARAAENTTSLHRRLIVTNIAADAQEDDVFKIFAPHFKFHV